MHSGVFLGFGGSAVLGSVVGGVLVVRHDREQPIFAFGVLVLLMSIWSASNAGVAAAPTFGWMLLFTQLSYIGVLAAPIVWLVFGLRYTNREEWLSNRRIALLSVIPAVTLPIVFTAQSHSLFYSGMSIVEGVHGPAFETISGPWYLVSVGYTYILFLIGTALFVAAAFDSNRLYRRQSVMLLVCTMIPELSTTLYLLGVRPLANADVTPIIFTIVSIPLGIIVQRTELGEFAPVAHDRIFRTLGDPVFVCGPDRDVVDANQAARGIVDDESSAVEGESITDILPSALTEDGELHPNLDTAFGCEMRRDGECHRYTARRREVNAQGTARSHGVLLVLTEVTEQKEQQSIVEEQKQALRTKTKQLEAKNTQLERLADVVAHDLATPLSTGENLLALIREDCTYEDDPELEQSIEDLEAVHERLREFADELPRVARESTTVDSVEQCNLVSVATSAWKVVDTDPLHFSIEIADTRTIEADPQRLTPLFENLFQNAVEHSDPDPPLCANGHAIDRDAPSSEEDSTRPNTRNASPNSGRRTQEDSQRESDPADRIESASESTDSESSGTGDVVTVTVGWFEATEAEDGASKAGFYIEDDGYGIPANRRADVLEFGVSTGSGPGYGLAIVRTIVESHGWSFHITDSASGGARFEIVTSR